MTRTTAKSIKAAIEKEIVAALEKIAKKHNTTLELGAGTYGSNRFALKVGFNDACGETSTSKTAAAAKGTPIDEFIGRSFKFKTKTFKVISYKANRPKNPVVLEDQNGRSFKCGVAMVVRAFTK